jgi:hypothetical protein
MGLFAGLGFDLAVQAEAAPQIGVSKIKKNAPKLEH